MDTSLYSFVSAAYADYVELLHSSGSRLSLCTWLSPVRVSSMMLYRPRRPQLWGAAPHALGRVSVAVPCSATAGRGLKVASTQRYRLLSFVGIALVLACQLVSFPPPLPPLARVWYEGVLTRCIQRALKPLLNKKKQLWLALTRLLAMGKTRHMNTNILDVRSCLGFVGVPYSYYCRVVTQL